MEEDRRLAPAEADRLLRLAAESDELATRHEDEPTLAHLLEAGEAAGIPPERIQRAAMIRPEPGTPVADLILGAPDHRTLEATVPLRGPVDRKAVADTLARQLGRSGSLQELNDGFTWFSARTLDRVRAVVRVEADRAEVTLTAEKAGHYMVSWFGGLVGWGLLATLLPAAALGPVGATVGFLAAPFLLARPYWTLQDRQLRTRMEQALMAVLEVLDRPAAPERLTSG